MTEELVEEQIRQEHARTDDAERALLGAMITYESAALEGLVAVEEDEFRSPEHRLIFRTIGELAAKGAPTDVTVLQVEIDPRRLDRVGGFSYLFDLYQHAHTPLIAYFVKQVKDGAVKRRYAQFAQQAVQITDLRTSSGLTAEEMATRVHEALDAASSFLTGATSGPVSIGEGRDEVLTYLDDIAAGRIEPGLSTGLADLDNMLDGLQPGQLIIVAGRPGSGKSTLAMDIARYNAIKRAESTLFVSLEMLRRDLTLRVMCAEGGIMLARMKKRGERSAYDLRAIVQAMDRIESSPLYLHAEPSTTIAAIRAHAKRLHATQGLRLLVVDYLQLLSSGKKSESRQQEVAEFSRGLKLLAMELEIPVIALSQLNRSSDQRADKRPALSDLRESGAIEQDADTVIMVHRPDDTSDTAELILAKNRGGPTGTVEVFAQLNMCRFVSAVKHAVPA
jgi:replicative DNA helicase